MKRRAFLFSAALAPLAGVLQQARATQTSASAPAPSLPYRDVHVASDAKRVMVFFAFSCPACRAYHNLVQTWAETLPSSLSFEFVPVVVPDANHVIAARAWYAAQLAAPSRMNQFAESVYSQIQDFKKPHSRPETWSEAAKIAGITGFTSAWPKVPAASIALSAKLLV